MRKSQPPTFGSLPPLFFGIINSVSFRFWFTSLILEPNISFFLSSYFSPALRPEFLAWMKTLEGMGYGGSGAYTQSTQHVYLTCTTKCHLPACLCILPEVMALIDDGTLPGTFSKTLPTSKFPSATGSCSFHGEQGCHAEPATYISISTFQH